MNIGIILSSGNGERLDLNRKKCFIEVLNKPLFSYSLETFLLHEQIDKVILTVPKGYIPSAEKYVHDDRVIIIEGGNNRQTSVFKALLEANRLFKDQNPYVLIHDGARPLISKQLISRHLVLKNAINDINSATYTTLKCSDSLLRVEQKKKITHLDRDKIYLEQTPTCLYLSKALDAFNNTNIDNARDDISIFKQYKMNLIMVEGDVFNFKVTYNDDYLLFKQLLENRK